jgi:hypothetical protein
MVTITADDTLEPGCEITRALDLKLSRTSRADEQVRENPGQTQHPHFEITSGEFDRTTLFKSAYRHSNKPEDRILRFLFW